MCSNGASVAHLAAEHGVSTDATLLVQLDAETLVGSHRAGDLDHDAAPGLEAGSLGDQLGQQPDDRADGHGRCWGVQFAGGPPRGANVLPMSQHV